MQGNQPQDSRIHSTRINRASFETRFMQEQERLAELVKTHSAWLTSLEGVTGAGVGLDEKQQLCIVVYTCGLGRDVQNSIRQRFEAEPVSFQETGPIVPQ